MEDEAADLAVAQPFELGLAGEALGDGLAADALDVEAASVIGDRDVTEPPS
jgi:hypothetical protein